MEKILTISIAAYNAEKDIERCLDSFVKSNVVQNLDIIVVNDGSNDSTENIVQAYVDKYPKSIRLINKKNGGHGSTINASIRIAVGKYYKIVDADDWVDSVNLEKLVNYLEKNDVDMILNPYNQVSYFNNTQVQIFNPNEAELKCGIKHELSDLNSKVFLYMHSLTFKTKIIKRMGSIIDENCYYVDMEYCIFPLYYIQTFSCLEYPVYQYSLGSENQSMNIKNLIQRRGQHLRVVKRLVEYYNKNFNEMYLTVRDAITTRIKYAIYQQYKIYMHMPPKEACIEIRRFDDWLRLQNKELYTGPKGKQMMFIKLNRITKYKCFKNLMIIARFFKI